MPPHTQSQRRSRAGHHDDTEDPRRRRQSRRNNESDDPDASEEDQDGDVSMERAGDGTDDQLVKKLVRYALACEYARIPIKRDGIRDKGELALYGTANQRGTVVLNDCHSSG